LGVTASRYEVDYYGETSSFLHRYGTDRLWVTWALNSQRTLDRIESGKSTQLDTRFIQDSTVLVRCADGRPLITNEPLSESSLIEIPSNIGEVAKEGPELASDWRAATRQAFTSALKAGYLVEDFRFDAESQKGVYLLTRK
jgi:predicted GNAT superfamily acetyltransferase